MLKALDLEMPKKIFGHPWVLASDSDKMSKSKGNVLYADDLVSEFGTDAIRYYLMHEIPYGHDGNISRLLIIDKINSDLANTMGNLVNRTINMCLKYFDGNIYKNNQNEPVDDELINACTSLNQKISEKMDELKIAEALENIMSIYRLANKYIDQTEPWKLAKDENKKERLKTVLYNLIEAIRVATVYLQAFLPETAEKIFKQINTNEKDISSTLKFNGTYTKVGNPEILFARIEKM